MHRTGSRLSMMALTAAAIVAGCTGPAATLAPSTAPSVGAVPTTSTATPTGTPLNAIVASFISVTQAPDRSMHVAAFGSVTFGATEQKLDLEYDIDGADYDGATTIRSDVIGEFSVLTIFAGGRAFTNTNSLGWREEDKEPGPRDPFGGLTTEGVQYVGPENAAGTDAHRLRFRDPIGVLATAMGSSSAEALQDLQVQATTYEVIVDATGHPLTATFTMSGTSVAVGAITASLRYTFTAWGADFAIVPPIEVGPSPPAGTALTIINRTTEPIVVRDASGTEVAVPSCGFAFASTFDTTRDVSILASDGHLLSSFSPSPDGPSFFGAYFAFTPSSTGYSGDALAQAEPCGPRSQP